MSRETVFPKGTVIFELTNAIFSGTTAWIVTEPTSLPL